MIEVLNFYPNDVVKQHSKVIGTLAIQFTEWKIKLLGVLVIKKGKKIIFCVPQRKTFQKETGMPIFFPLIYIDDPDKRQQFSDELQKKGVEFIKKYPEGKPPVSEEVVQEVMQEEVDVLKARTTSKFVKKKVSV